MEQMDLFAQSYERYKITKPIRLIECFAGIGAQAKALENLGIPYESHRISEWAIPSIKAYAAIHHGWRGEPLEGYSLEEMVAMTDGISADYCKPLTEAQRRKKGAKELAIILGAMKACKDDCPDISKVTGESLGIESESNRGHCYIMTYSFPCQDLSQAGTTQGMTKGSGTRSGLLWEIERILLELQDRHERPDILIMENVPQVHGAKNLKDFQAWVKALDGMGYSSYYKDLNAKDFGIPQNRDRCFMVSILGQWGYNFPKKSELKYPLRNYLDKRVDEWYYLPDKYAEKFQRYGEDGNPS